MNKTKAFWWFFAVLGVAPYLSLIIWFSLMLVTEVNWMEPSRFWWIFEYTCFCVAFGYMTAGTYLLYKKYWG